MTIAHPPLGGPGSPPAIVVMGVAGCGKSTLATHLADLLDARFLEGDDLHPPANIATMTSGAPLTDEDRVPWLDTIAEHLAAELRAGRGTVVACSALKRAYRDRLRTAGDVWFVHLALDHHHATTRVAARPGHFLRTALIPSQFAALQPLGTDEPGITLDATQSLDRLFAELRPMLATTP